jgi:acylphosphatase
MVTDDVARARYGAACGADTQDARAWPVRPSAMTGRADRIVRAHVRVAGRVQGVFFRAETRDRASSLGLSGWVRNAHDGSVEAAFEGPAERVRSMVDWCRRGPALAAVEDVSVDWEEPEGEREFQIR